MKKSYFFKSVVLLAVMLVSCFGKVSAQTWQMVDISELAPGDVFVIVDLNSGCAMSNDNGTGSAPAAVSVSISGDQITNVVADNLKWNISGNSSDGYIFYPNGTTETWLYCSVGASTATGSNNNMRVGTGENKTFILHSNNWLAHVYTETHTRYVGVYNSSDWRGYNNTNNNIANTQTRFFRYTEEDSSVETPVISPNGGIYYEPQTVTISCATDGAVIHYTLDGTTPNGTSAVYSEPLTINTTTTVKAIAIVGEDASNVATATYTLPVEVATIAELRAQSTGSTLYRLTGASVVTFSGYGPSGDSHYTYIQDATAGMYIYDQSGSVTNTLSNGMVISTFIGRLDVYRNMLELIPEYVGEVLIADSAVDPIEISLAQLDATYQAQLVKVMNVTFAEEGTFGAANNSTTYALAESDVVTQIRYRDNTLSGTEIPTTPQNLTALVYQYNDLIELALLALEDYIPEPTECENAPTMGACTAVLDERDMLFTGQVAVDDTLCTLHEYGFVYSVMNTEPELNDDLCTTVVLGTAIEAGEEFSYRLAELGYDTYYVRAFATNEVGTGYSEVASVQQAVPEEYTVHFVVSGRTELEAAPTLYFREGQDPLELPVIDGCENLAFAGWTLVPFEGQTTEAPALVSSFVPVADTTFYAVFSSTQNLINDEIVISRSSFAEVAGYDTDDQWTVVSKNAGTEITGWCDLYTNNATMQMRVNTPYGSYPYNVTALPGNITSISMYAAGGGSARQWTPWLSSSPLNKENHQTGTSLETKYLEPSSSVMWNVDAALNANYFYIELSGGAAYVDSIVVVYTSGDALYTMSAVDTVIINQAICEGLTYEDDHFSTGEEGTHTYLQTNGDYCATQYILNLSVNAVDHVEFAETACDSYTWNNEVYTESGDYVQTFTNANGCDSVVTLHLTINSSDHAELAETACISYVWNEEVYEESGDYVQTFTNANGCDSVVTLHLTIYQPATELVEVTICENDLPYHYVNGDIDTTFEVGTPQLSTFNFQLLTSHGCDSVVTLNLTIYQPVNETVEVTICGSELPYHYVNGDIDTTFEVGTPNFSVFSFQFSTSHGCDSTVNLNLTINHGNYMEVTVDTCGTEFYWELGDITVAQSGTYYHYSTNANTCTDTTVLLLSLYQPAMTEISAQICEGETYNQNGFNVSTAGDHQLDLQTVNGCDSTVVLHLAVGSETITYLTASVCEGENYDENGFTITAPAAGVNEYSRTIERPGTCDSIVNLTLTVNVPTEGDTTAVACGSFDWHGQQLTESGNYTDVMTNAAGCDSTVTLHLTINVATEGDTTAVACGSFDWHGQHLTESGNYTDVLTNAAGCDSTVTLHLTINVATEGDTTATACGSFDWHGQTLTASGNYTDVMTNAAGCDSTVTLYLTINVATEGDTTAVACGSFDWHGQHLTASGNYTDVLTNAAGCDSTVTLHLTINIATEGDTTAVACGSFDWHGQQLTESGNYTDVMTNAAGCDSTVTLHLTINVATEGDTTATACGSFDWHGQTLTESGDYTDVLTNAVGCDSTVTLHLTINVADATEFTETACGSYVWNDEVYEESGDYVQTFTNANGCDSVVTLHLTVTTINTEIEWNGTPEGTDSLVVSQEDAEYQWIDCATNEPIEGATQSQFEPVVSGSYACVITLGECTDTTDCIDVTISGIADYTDGIRALYPNPTSGIVTLQLTPETCHLNPEIQIFDIYGKRLQVMSVNGEATQIDLSSYTPGVYLIKLVGDGRVIGVRKVVRR